MFSNSANGHCWNFSEEIVDLSMAVDAMFSQGYKIMVSARTHAVNKTKRIFGDGADVCSNSKSKSSETLYILQPQPAVIDYDVKTNCQKNNIRNSRKLKWNTEKQK